MSIDVKEAVKADDFKAVLGRWATGVAVVTTRDASGEPVGLTVNSFASVSLDPPLVLFSIDRSAGSFAAFEAAGSFAVNVLRADQQDVSNRFAAADATRFQGDATETWVTGAPILSECLSALDCTVDARHDGGDHVIMVGRVQRLSVLHDGDALSYWKGGYRSLGETSA
jgi:flavin reductase (DIM6/NTAB) family NADH-FMN oxidoreductase RutF